MKATDWYWGDFNNNWVAHPSCVLALRLEGYTMFQCGVYLPEHDCILHPLTDEEAAKNNSICPICGKENRTHEQPN